MRKKLHDAKNYVAEHKGAFLIGGVVVIVYGSVVTASVYGYKTAGVQFETAKLLAS